MNRDFERAAPGPMLRVRDILYASLPLALAAWQLWALRNEAFQIRYEELAEAIRNPYWFEHRFLYDGVSSNVGWYGLLNLVYSTLGFDLFYGRVVKVVLYGLGLIAISRVARRNVGLGVGAILVFSVGLSPTYLYFSRIMTSHATDLSFAAIWLWLIVGRNWNAGGRDEFCVALAWAVAMLGCMSMPSFLPYLPAMGLLFLLLLFRSRDRRIPHQSARYLAVAAVGFAVPLLAASLYIRGPLFYDPGTDSGLFRGGGYFDGSPSAIGKAAMVVLRDLFVTGNSYYFDLQRVEFGSDAAVVALVAVGVGAALAFAKNPRRRPYIGMALLLTAAGLFVPSLSSNYPGLRRATGMLAGVYLLYTFALAECFRSRERMGPLRILLAVLLLLLPVSHGLAQYDEIGVKRGRSRHAAREWFATNGPPLESFAHWLAYTEREGSLPACDVAHSRPMRSCRYSEIFAAVDGYRVWNGESSVPISVADPKTGEVAILSAATGKFP